MNILRIPARMIPTIVLLFLAGSIMQVALAQTGITMAVLIPHTVVVDPALQSRYDSTEASMEVMRAHLLELMETSGVSSSTDSMARLMDQNTHSAYSNFSLSVLGPYMAQMTYMYMLSGTHVTMRKDIYVYLQIDSSAGSTAELREKAARYGCRFVANFPELRFQQDGKTIRGTMRGQLYDRQLDSIVIDASFQGNDREKISAFDCSPGSLMCVVNNCTIPFIERSSHYLMKVLEKSERRKKE